MRRITLEAEPWQLAWFRDMLETYGRYRIIYEDETTVDCYVFEPELGWDRFCAERRMP